MSLEYGILGFLWDKAPFFSGIIKFVFADIDAAGVTFNYFDFDFPGGYLFIDGEVVSRSQNIETEWQLWSCLKPYSPK